MLHELKNEIWNIPDSFKNKMKVSEELISRKKHTQVNERYINPDDRPIRQNNRVNLFHSKETSNTDCGIIVSPLASKQMYKTTKEIRQLNYISEKYSETNISMHSSVNNPNLNDSRNLILNPDSKKNYLRKRSKLKYDPMQSAKLDKSKVMETWNVNNSNIKADESQNILKDDNSKAVLLYKPSNRNGYKRGESNSQIIQQRQPINNDNHKCNTNYQTGSNDKYNSITKIPRLSKSKAKYEGTHIFWS